jgi:hypothetical protein
MGALTAAQGACIAATAEQANRTTSKLTIDTKQDLLFNPPVDKPIGKYRVTVWVNVPRNRVQGQNCIEKLRAVPYLTDVPQPLHTYGPMSEKYGEIKDSLYILCYVAPQNATKHIYAGQGYRFNACLEAAKRESGLGVPHLLPEAKAWCEAMYPYIHKYIVRSNEAEALRRDRAAKAKSDYDETHTEVEYAALKKGFFAVDLNPIVYHLSLRRAVVDLPEGTWWITGTHNVMGISYYWQEPIEVGPDKPNAVELNEANALVIESQGW